ncbi:MULTISPECIES: SHOCT domain-containing protein [unclassified Gordonia (in: high G+C Gram-positive bacteria)]|uniref:SHOCT domain-containing protein n=1 Tax=unclassified Gordonia (in: high G+C Gram-positive bacteria) TaxID=2657482 RepID=UPI001F108476|nr:PLDc N-terminal domain-containing protein [Gordonia sp. ABSL49_1]MCH5641634.1 PLDc N-terminal domain-containing protein [Gordonia sp. ABSL49_1]
MWDSFWDFIWYTIVIFAFVAYLIVLWHIISDLFRDKASSGWAKAAWVIFLIIFPYLTAIVYLLAKGKGMAERQREAYAEAKKASDAYIQSVAGATPAQQISEAKSLLDAGSITPEEFEALKAKALS